MQTLPHCGKIEIRQSNIEGFGVFATEDISAGTVLEEVPFILFPRCHNMAKTVFNSLRENSWLSQKESYLENLRENLGFKDPEKYYFKWHPSVQLDNDSMYTVLPLGFGPIYNTSNTKNNADWKIGKNTFTFRAEKDIKKDEEITTFYGYFLGENGTTFNCENVFHLAIDMFNINDSNVHRVKMLRFGSVETLNTQKSNPSAHQIHNLLLKSSDGLSIKKIVLLSANKDIVANFEVPTDISLSTLYQRLMDAKNHPAPIIDFHFEYLDKATNIIGSQNILWKK